MTMSQTYVSSGRVMTFTAPTGGVTAGTPVLIADLLVVPRNTVAQTLPFDADAEGVHKLMPKATGQAWVEGAILYWDNSAFKFTTTANANRRAGVAAAAAAGGDTTGSVRLDGIALGGAAV
jgi:predicted RecA/RadA family phage recombinase